MERHEILEKINESARGFFDNNDGLTSDPNIPSDDEGFDSFSQLSFMNDIEDKFDIRFTPQEIVSLNDVGDLVDAVERHIREKQ